MNVILVDNIASLGKAGDRVKVSDGYARNFLIPKGLAVEATSNNAKVIEHKKNSILQKNAKEKKKAEAVKEQLAGMICTIERRVGEQGKLFGSVNTKDIETALQKQGVEIDRKHIVMDDVIKALGEYPIKIKLHSGVDVEVTVAVVAEA
ncbi:MAG: 50S ribosomal protein L9 [Deltaproteobacteria bacterium]|nr:50S ribosomal protein L9 [Deltaproteobacteria bacterium]